MKKIKSFLGYTYALICIPIILAGFIEMDFLGSTIVSATGVTINPRLSGGKVINTITHSEYNTLIHKSVFDGLFSERNDGFVQIDWTPLNSLPENIEEEIDYDGDGSNDFKIILDTKNCSGEIKAYNSYVMSLEGCYKLKNSIAARIFLKNKHQ